LIVSQKTPTHVIKHELFLRQHKQHLIFSISHLNDQQPSFAQPHWHGLSFSRCCIFDPAFSGYLDCNNALDLTRCLERCCYFTVLETDIINLTNTRLASCPSVDAQSV